MTRKDGRQYECPACGYVATQEEMEEQGEGMCPRCGYAPMTPHDPYL